MLNAKKREKDEAAVSLGKRGGTARAKKLSKRRRVEIAKNAAEYRWGKLMKRNGGRK